jgi:hypothetical protein
MRARSKCRRQSDVASHHQYKTPSATDPRQIPAEGRATRFAIVAKHHAGEAPRQMRRRGTRVGQPATVGEQP